MFEYCHVTDASVLAVASGCSNLHTLNLGGCENITSACKNAHTYKHPQLQLKD